MDDYSTRISGRTNGGVLGSIVFFFLAFMHFYSFISVGALSIYLSMILR